MNREKYEFIVVGGGLAGLNCARILNEAGHSVLVLEADDRPGGRVQTDEVDGFMLDRGFQILLTAYPEAQATLDYQELDLHAYYPGALVRYEGRFERIVDPWRRPLDALRTIASPVGTFSDRQKIASIRRQVLRGQADQLFERSETSTLNYLRNAGVSQQMIDNFFAPLFGGIFLDRSLRTTSRMFEFVFRMMAEGDIAIPRDGMGAIAAQLAATLPDGAICTGCRVTEIESRSVTLESGVKLEAGTVVVAVDGSAASQLTDLISPPPRYVPVTCLYFAADRAPLTEPVLVLNADEPGPVNNLTVASAVSPAYAPPGATLISATVLDGHRLDNDLESEVRSQLGEWFGGAVDGWKLLRTYHIEHALPVQAPSSPGYSTLRAGRRNGLYFCGDYLENGSINGALLSGRRVAEAIIAEGRA